MVEKQRKVKFLNALMSCWTIHKQGEPSELFIETYWNVLKKYTDKEIEKAFTYAISAMDWFPKPAQLISFLEGGPGDIEDTALIEADKVLNAIKQYGSYQSVAFDDPTTMAVIVNAWGGWIEICKMLINEEKWFRKDFVKIYKAYNSKGIKKYGHLIGIIENNNASKWPEHVPETILIGDRSKASVVLELGKQKDKKLLDGQPNSTT